MSIVLAVLALVVALYALLGLILTERRHTREMDAAVDRIQLLETGLAHHLNTTARWHG